MPQRQPGNSNPVCREHGIVRDEQGVAFMADEHPLADLAPRDVVARAIARRLVERGLEHLWLDATPIPDFERRFPTIWRACTAIGLDPSKDWLPCAPAAHYVSGGVCTDLDGAINLAEFAYNLDPLVVDAVPVTATGTNGLPAARYLANVSGGVLEVQFVRRKGPTAVGLTYAVQFSGNLAGWTSGLAPVVTALSTDWERVTVRDAVSGPSTSRFGRVLATIQQ